MIVLNPDAKPTEDGPILPTAVHLRSTVSHPTTDPELPSYDTLSVYDLPKKRQRFTRARIKRLAKIALISGLFYLIITIIALTIVKKKKGHDDDDDDGPQSMNRHNIDHRTRERTSDAPYPPITISDKEGSRIACNAWVNKTNSSELRLSYTFPSNTSSMFVRSIGGVPIGGSLIVMADPNVADITIDVTYHSSVMHPKDLVDVCLMRKAEAVGLGIYTASTMFIKNMQPSIFSLVLRLPDDPDTPGPLVLGNFNTVLPFFTQTFLDLREKVTFHNVDLAGLGTDVFTTQHVQAHKFTVESKLLPKTFGGKRRRGWKRFLPKQRQSSKASKLQPHR